MKLLTGAVFILSLLWVSVSAQSTYPVNPNLDVLHYTFHIGVSDSSDEISGEATILFTLQAQDTLVLDMVGLNGEGKGMVVDKISSADCHVTFTHDNNRLSISLNTLNKHDQHKIIIHYSGIPAGGLIIDDNKFGDRVFFGDNYPDRARNWLPCIDHPSDKATVTWQITAPDHYKVVASGKLIGETQSSNNFKTTTWDEKVPISTKVMVFGAANFAIDHAGSVGSAPVTTWVYKQNKKEGFHDFAIAPKVLAYYDSLIGTYPYEKLANVQSKTTYGGMENAGNIFYFENSVNGKGESEKLIAHEIVHQWFGNSATERDWPHAWLSEGFATYLTHVYVGSRFGLEQMKKGLASDRERVIEYWYKNPLPIVNYDLVTYPGIADLRELLSTNTYQKAGWVLHMLRNELGDEVFWQVIRNYYAEFKDSVATTADFQKVVEEVSSEKMNYFFKQWLYGQGQPVLAGELQYRNGEVTVEINQKQENLFIFPLELGLVYGDKIVVKKVNVSSSKVSFSFSEQKPDHVIIDPNTKLLFEGEGLLKSNQK